MEKEHTQKQSQAMEQEKTPEQEFLSKVKARTSAMLWNQNRNPSKFRLDYKPRLTLENLYQKFFWQLESHAIEEILKEKAKVTQSINELSKERDW